MIPMCQDAQVECLPWCKLRYLSHAYIVGKALSPAPETANLKTSLADLN